MSDRSLTQRGGESKPLLDNSATTTPSTTSPTSSAASPVSSHVHVPVSRQESAYSQPVAHNSISSFAAASGGKTSASAAMTSASNSSRQLKHPLYRAASAGGTGFQVFDEDIPVLEITPGQTTPRGLTSQPTVDEDPQRESHEDCASEEHNHDDDDDISVSRRASVQSGTLLPHVVPHVSTMETRQFGPETYKPHSFDERTALTMRRSGTPGLYDDSSTTLSDFEDLRPRKIGRSTSFSLNQDFDDERLDQDLSHVHMAELIVGVVANLNDETDLSADQSEHRHDESSIFESFFDLTHARLQHIFRAFDELSKSKEAGVVDYRNFRKSLRDAGLDIRDETSFKNLVQKVDLDLDGGITFAEFETVVQSLKLAHVLRSSRLQWQRPFRCINYNSKRAEEERVDSKRIKDFMYNPRPSWATHRWIELVTPCTFHLKCLAIKHRLHPLALEDCLKDSARSRAKLDRYDTHVLVSFPVMTLVYGQSGDGADNSASRTRTRTYSLSRSTSGGKDGRSYSAHRNRWNWGTPSRNTAAEPLIRRQVCAVDEDRSYTALGHSKPEIQKKKHRFRSDSHATADGEPMIHVEVPRVVKHNAYIFLSRPDLTTTITVINDECAEVDVFRRVRRELQVSYSRLRTHDGMYLLYSLIDCLADSFVPLVHELESILMQLSAQVRDERHNVVSGEGEQRFSEAYHDMIRELQNLKRWMVPAQRVVSNLIAEEELIESDCKIYLRDVHDHLEQITDDINSILGGLQSLKEEHDHQIEVRMSGTMNALTIVATASLPGQFLASVFGMNFDSMEELHWKYGYPMFWCLTIASWSLLFFYFRSKGYV